MATYLPPTASFVQKSLSGAITNSQTTITLNNTTNLQAPGTLVIDRVDSNGNLTASAREIVAYTGIAGNDITGCTRAFDGSTAYAHADGAICETTLTAQGFASLVTTIATFADTNGYIRAIASPVSIGRGDFIQIDVASVASIAEIRSGNLMATNATITGSLNLSNASVTGVGLYPVWRSSAAYSGPTIGIGGLLVAPKPATWSWVSVVTRSVASGTSVVFDIMNNGVSIFAGVTPPTILAGGTYVSTASINTKAISPGQILRADIKTIASGVGVITDVTVQGGTT
jgi:hypothetical protein